MERVCRDLQAAGKDRKAWRYLIDGLVPLGDVRQTGDNSIGVVTNCGHT